MVGIIMLASGRQRTSNWRAEMEGRHDLVVDTYEVGKLTLDEYLGRVVFYQKRSFTRAQFRSFMFAQSKTARHPAVREVDVDRESIWISYARMALDGGEPYRLGPFACHHRLAAPVAPWERLKIGGGTPPVRTRYGWLIVYHGVSEVVEPDKAGHPLCYSAGVMVLSKEHPRVIRYRSVEPVLAPVLPQERHGVVSNVVFSTGIDRRDDLGSPDRFDVYYGMADKRIGVARLDLPDRLPPEGVADPPGGKV
jgi:predicted GH43/DUF377 family glycosyl hydrolase